MSVEWLAKMVEIQYPPLTYCIDSVFGHKFTYMTYLTYSCLLPGEHRAAKFTYEKYLLCLI